MLHNKSTNIKSLLKRIVFLFFVAVSCQSLFAAGVSKYVAVNNAVLRQKDSASSKEVCKVNYAECVVVVEEKGKWSLVQKENDSSAKGWINTSALSKKKIVASRNVNVDAKEIALAGKGLTKSLETQMCSDYNYDFSAIDKIESVKVSEQELTAFMKEGNLKVEEE